MYIHSSAVYLVSSALGNLSLKKLLHSNGGAQFSLTGAKHTHKKLVVT